MVFIFLVTPNILSIVATIFRKFFYGTQRNKISRMFDIKVLNANTIGGKLCIDFSSFMHKFETANRGVGKTDEEARIVTCNWNNYVITTNDGSSSWP